MFLISEGRYAHEPASQPKHPAQFAKNEIWLAELLENLVQKDEIKSRVLDEYILQVADI